MKGRALVVPFLLWNITFILLPVALVLLQSLHPVSLETYDILPQWTMDNFRRAINPDFLPVLARSAQYAGLTTLFCLLLGYPLAYTIAVYGGRFRSKLLILIVLPFWTSYLIRTYAWMTLLQTEGLANWFLLKIGLLHAPIQWLNSPFSVVLGLTYGFLPFCTLPIYVSLEQMDRSLVEAAQDLGSTPFSAFKNVVFPLSLPGVISGSLLTFVPAMGDFVTPEILGGPQTQMIGNVIQQQFLQFFNWPFGSALSLALMVLMMFSIAYTQRGAFKS